MAFPRIRQLVFASHDAEDIDRLRDILDLGAGFVDPGVSVFGLTNGVFALGDQFLEVVVPVEDNTAAGRFLDRNQGEGGYMAIFQTDDIARVRAHADAEAIRRVWDIDIENISASHFHPADIGAAIVSVDEARPAGSWRWGGPDWQDQARPGGLTALEISARDPEQMALRWGQLLGAIPRPQDHGIWIIPLSGGDIHVVLGSRDFIKTFTLAHPDPDACVKRAAKYGFDATGLGFRFAGVDVELVAH